MLLRVFIKCLHITWRNWIYWNVYWRCSDLWENSSRTSQKTKKCIWQDYEIGPKLCNKCEASGSRKCLKEGLKKMVQRRQSTPSYSRLQRSKDKGVCKVGGMVKSVGKFMPNLTDFISSCQALIKKSTQWYSSLERAYRANEVPVFRYFDTSTQT